MERFFTDTGNMAVRFIGYYEGKLHKMYEPSWTKQGIINPNDEKALVYYLRYWKVRVPIEGMFWHQRYVMPAQALMLNEERVSALYKDTDDYESIHHYYFCRPKYNFLCIGHRTGKLFPWSQNLSLTFLTRAVFYSDALMLGSWFSRYS